MVWQYGFYIEVAFSGSIMLRILITSRDIWLEAGIGLNSDNASVHECLLDELESAGKCVSIDQNETQAAKKIARNLSVSFLPIRLGLI